VTNGVGTGAPNTDQTGLFWFFDERNIELAVKIIDGRFVPGHLYASYWVFFGALSDVEYTITVTDKRTGAVRSYHNLPGTFCGQADLFAFEDPVEPASSALEERPTGSDDGGGGVAPRTPSSASLPPPASCTASPQDLCLISGRFRVSVAWTNQHSEPTPGAQGSGTAVPLTDESGSFWFFDKSNLELIVKIVDSKGYLGNNYWVFYGALSDVEYTITVTDTKTGLVKTYRNPPGTFCGDADLMAFAK
jgi:hypothetical protein